jgi:hypothetical protein
MPSEPFVLNGKQVLHEMAWQVDCRCKFVGRNRERRLPKMIRQSTDGIQEQTYDALHECHSIRARCCQCQSRGTAWCPLPSSAIEVSCSLQWRYAMSERGRPVFSPSDLVPPKSLESIRRPVGVAHGVCDVLVTEVVLQGSGVVDC